MVLICVSLMTIDVEHLFMCHLYVFFGKLSSVYLLWKNVSSVPLCNFKLGRLCSFCFDVELYEFFVYFGC